MVFSAQVGKVHEGRSTAQLQIDRVVEIAPRREPHCQLGDRCPLSELDMLPVHSPLFTLGCGQRGVHTHVRSSLICVALQDLQAESL